MFDDHEFRKERLFGIDFDVVTMKDAVNWVFRNVATGRHTATRYVVTPNVSLTMQHQDSLAFRKVIHHAALTVVDGQPLVTASKWLGRELPERVAGSDLVYHIFDAAIPEMPLKIFFLGAAPGVADRAAEVVASRWPAVRVVGTLSPEFGFEHSPNQNRQILKAIQVAEPDILIIGLGAPKQETWAFQHREKINATVTLCVGGTIDFIAGEQTRAPKWIRTCGFEWVWRMATNPRRLFGRYFRDSLRLPGLFLDEVSGQCPVYQSSELDDVVARSPETTALSELNRPAPQANDEISPGEQSSTGRSL